MTCNCIIFYVVKKTQIWKWCCNEDIPKNEMVDYCRRYTGGYQDYRKWLHIYQNWYAWHNPSDITCKMKGTPVEISRISCLAVLGNENINKIVEWKWIINKLVIYLFSNIEEDMYNDQYLVYFSLKLQQNSNCVWK